MNALKIGTLTAAALLVGAVAVGGIASTRANKPEAVANAAELAKRAFWDGFGGGSVEAVVAARDQMIAAFDAYPHDGELPHLIGGAYAFSVAELGWALPEIDPSEIASYLQAGYEYTQLGAKIPAHDQREQFKRIGFHGGPTFKLGSQLGDEALKQEARELIDVSIRGTPDFGYLTLGDVLRDEATHSADFANALEAYFDFFEYCTGETLDRTYPDMTPALSMRTDTGNPTCGNSPKVPHGLPGMLFVFAEVLVKNGQFDAARPVYELVRQSDGYATWASRYQDLVDQRLASDLAERAAQYQGDDVSQYPELGMDCFGCHQR